MHPYILLIIASSGLAGAGWVKLPGYRDLVGRGSFPPPRETGRVNLDDSKGWTPKPTPAPGSISELDAVLELLRDRRAVTSNTWEDDTTCGWTAGVSCMCPLPFTSTVGSWSGELPGSVLTYPPAEPFTCPPQYSCRTNTANVVGCASGTYSPFYTVCLDMQAFEQGACASIGPQTGCW